MIDHTARELHFEGCFNVRDLGGLPTQDGQTTAFGKFVRSDAIHHLTEQGWAAAYEYGIRTIIDLRNEDERPPDVHPRPEQIQTLWSALDGVEDTEFWDFWGGNPRFATPMYYEPHVRRFPHLHVDVLRLLAQANEGITLFHCASGRDRTGLISMHLLSFVGVTPDVIAQDHCLSESNVKTMVESRGKEYREGPIVDAFLKKEQTTRYDLLCDALSSLPDLEEWLLKHGLEETHLETLKHRLCPPCP